ncbi:hypothetical protein STH12_04269 (plasmid) [Shewanella khirikhana]|uniref:Uncharacterized protein n=1 Tax=Shewanella khirikhana TaxID=1965282 RepID=A0ABM7DXK3_9GAMM|nr:hypothetical protein STH12_04269 [Shewanella khirikhana]
MDFLQCSTLNELDWYWIRKFRASKCIETLEIQASGAERKIRNDQSLAHRERRDNLASINTAYCFRELELPLVNRG